MNGSPQLDADGLLSGMITLMSCYRSMYGYEVVCSDRLLLEGL